MNPGNRFFPLVVALLLLTSFILLSCQNKNIALVTNGLATCDDGCALAINDLISVLESSGYKVQIVSDSETDTTINFNTIVIEEVNEGLGESYRIKPKKIKGRNVLEVGGGERGLMYGIFKLAEEIRLKKQIWNIDLEKSPGFSRRMYAEEGQLLNFPSVGYHLFQPPWVNHGRLEAEVKELKLLIDQIARLGFNTFTILHVNFEDYINYKYLDREVYGSDDVHRIKSVHFARHMTDLINYAHRRHIEVFLQVYEFQYPPRLGELYQLDLQHPDTEKIINAKVRELFESVPFDGLVITATESNPRSGYLSKNLWQKYGKEGAGKLMTLYHQAAKAAGKTAIFRSWLIAYGAEDSHLVIENTPEDAQLEIKHTGRDFFLNFPLTDAIAGGLGKIRPLTITFDVFPQYYGWSRLVCYQKRIAEEARLARQNGVTSIQAWGAWSAGCIWSDQHPGYKSDGQLIDPEKKIVDWAGLWNNFRIFTRGFTPGQMNAYQVSRIMWDTGLSAEDIALDWGKMYFGAKNAGAVARVLMNSQDAFRELYPPGKFKMPYSPVYLNWATMLMLNQERMAEVYSDDVNLPQVIERNKAGYAILELMRDAMSEIDERKVPDKEIYDKFLEGFEKTELYLSMFFEYREFWVRNRDIGKGIATRDDQFAYEACRARLNHILEEWKKYQEECKFWGISSKIFSIAAKGKTIPYTKFVTRELSKEPAFYTDTIK